MIFLTSSGLNATIRAIYSISQPSLYILRTKFSFAFSVAILVAYSVASLLIVASRFFEICSSSNNVIIIVTTSISRFSKYSFNTSFSLQMCMVSSIAWRVLPYSLRCSSYTFIKLHLKPMLNHYSFQ